MIVYEIKKRFKMYRKCTGYYLLLVYAWSLASTTYEVFYVYRTNAYFVVADNYIWQRIRLFFFIDRALWLFKKRKP